MNIFSEFLGYQLIKTASINLTVGHIFAALFILLVAKAILIVAKRLAIRASRKNNNDYGRYHSLYLIFSYLIWVIAFVLSLEALGAKISILLASGAALMVGIGLGLQNIFNDLVSGIFILFERAIEINDVIEVDGVVGKIQKISLRNTQILTRDEVVFIVPNHKFVAEKIVNYSHKEDVSRYSIEVGVAYGSDTAKVIEILNSCPLEFDKIKRTPKAFARFEQFGDSSLNFKLFFFSDDNFRIDNTKGKLRLLVDKKFRENNITIPFPQRDLHIKSGLHINPPETNLKEDKSIKA